MVHQVAIDNSAIIDESYDDLYIEVANDVAYKRLVIVNVAFVGDAENWVLIDAGIKGSAEYIRRAAESRFKEIAPRAIILTHGHFDHVGALQELCDAWKAPVFAHEQEMGYLNGSRHYPPPDPSVGGGAMSFMSRFFPTSPINVSTYLHPLPSNGSVPFSPEWQWVHTPGHTAGHISLWRKLDRTIITGDAVITTAQESAYAVFTQECEIHGPPQYFTPDWDAAENSVNTIADLHPELLVPGHGRALIGTEVEDGLQILRKDFKNIAVPKEGRYVHYLRR